MSTARTTGKAMGVDEATPTRARPSTRRSAMALVEASRDAADIVGLTADLGKYTDIHPVPRRLPGPLLQRRHGRAEPRRRRRRARPDRHGAVRHHLRRLRHPPRLRLHRDRLRPQQRQREDHRRAARPHHRLRRHPPGDRGPGADADDPRTWSSSTPATRPTSPRSPRRSPTIPGRSTCGCCAATCRRCSTPPPTASRSARRSCSREGSDVGIISTGLDDRAARSTRRRCWRAEGSTAGVLHVPTLKPFDARGGRRLRRAPRRGRHRENHVVGRRPRHPGRASACSRPACESKVAAVGIPDAFIELGAAPTLDCRAGIAARGAAVWLALDAPACMTAGGSHERGMDRTEPRLTRRTATTGSAGRRCGRPSGCAAGSAGTSISMRWRRMPISTSRRRLAPWRRSAMTRPAMPPGRSPSSSTSCGRKTSVRGAVRAGGGRCRAAGRRGASGRPRRVTGSALDSPMKPATKGVAGAVVDLVRRADLLDAALDITTTRSASSIASSWSWVTKTVVWPVRSWISRSQRRSSRRTLASSAPNGSSSSSMRGSMASARASATRWRWPPESCVG